MQLIGLISAERAHALAKRSAGQVKEFGLILPEVVLHPTAIFQGIREEGERDWLCYCGLPTNAYRGFDGSRRAPYLGEVYVVFVNADRVAYNSRWEKCSVDDHRLVSSHDSRFERRLL